MLSASAFIALTVVPEHADARRRSVHFAKPYKAKRARRVRSSAAYSAYSGSASFSSCREARAAGAAPIRSGDNGYSRRLDRDGDGIACE
jgi:Excalibur calcium-binding domain